MALNELLVFGHEAVARENVVVAIVLRDADGSPRMRCVPLLSARTGVVLQSLCTCEMDRDGEALARGLAGRRSSPSRRGECRLLRHSHLRRKCRAPPGGWGRDTRSRSVMSSTVERAHPLGVGLRRDGGPGESSGCGGRVPKSSSVELPLDGRRTARVCSGTG